MREMTMLNISNRAVLGGTLLLLFHGATGPPAQGGERHVVLTNNTREAIVEVYVSDVGAGNWQADLLGADFLMPGGSVMVDIDDRNGRCRVDFKTVLDDGSDLVSRSINVCRSEDTAVSLR
jgi:hypothetical protein